MRLYFGRRGQYRGFSTGPLFWIIAGAIALAVVLAIGRDLILLAPFIALWALVIWLARPLFHRREHRETKPGTGQQ